MKTPLRAILLILGFEKLRTLPYDDGVGVWTVGWGHALGKVRPPAKPITEDEAAVLFEADLDRAERDVLAVVKVPLSAFQLGALVSFVFNVGGGAFASSTLLRRLNAGEFAAVPEELMRWTKGTVKGQKVELAGLVRRRTAEATLWRLGSDS